MLRERSIYASLAERRVASSNLIKAVMGVERASPVDAATGEISLRCGDGEWLMTLCTMGTRSGQKSVLSRDSTTSAGQPHRVFLASLSTAMVLHGQ